MMSASTVVGAERTMPAASRARAARSLSASGNATRRSSAASASVGPAPRARAAPGRPVAGALCALPPGVSEPVEQPNFQDLTFGFTARAERWNSRASMIGFFALLALEGIAHKGILELMGINIGNGLGFEL